MAAVPGVLPTTVEAMPVSTMRAHVIAVVPSVSVVLKSVSKRRPPFAVPESTLTIAPAILEAVSASVARVHAAAWTT